MHFQEQAQFSRFTCFRVFFSFTSISPQLLSSSYSTSIQSEWSEGETQYSPSMSRPSRDLRECILLKAYSLMTQLSKRQVRSLPSSYRCYRFLILLRAANTLSYLILLSMRTNLLSLGYCARYMTSLSGIWLPMRLRLRSQGKSGKSLREVMPHQLRVNSESLANSPNLFLLSLLMSLRLMWVRSKLVNSRGIFFSYSHTRFNSFSSFLRGGAEAVEALMLVMIC